MADISERFLMKLREAVEGMRDADGEPGYFASIVYEADHLGDRVLFVNTGPDDVQEKEEKYALTIRRLR